jgi:DNA-binding transcriptional regulator WhiA
LYKDEEPAEKVMGILKSMGFNVKVTQRKGSRVVYMKDADR